MDTEKNNPYKGGEHIEQKKSAKANLEKKKTTGLLIGLVAVFAFLYVALELTEVEREKVQEALEPAEVQQVNHALKVFKTKMPKRPKPQKQVTKIEDEVKIVKEDTKKEDTEIVAPDDMFDDEPMDYEDVGEVQVEEEIEEEAIEMAPDKKAEFPGGIQAMYKFLSKNIKYPAVSLNSGSQGTTTLRFVVEKDGIISRVEILKSSGDPYLDKEAIRVLGTMPKWSPGERQGMPVRSYFVLPVKFTINN